MAIYKISEIMSLLSDIARKGALYVDIEELYTQENGATGLDFSVVQSDFCEGVGTVEAHPDVSDHELEFDMLSPSTESLEVVFTYKELADIATALDCAIRYGKICAKDPSTTKDEQKSIKSDSIAFRNLLAKIRSNQSFKIVFKR